MQFPFTLAKDRQFDAVGFGTNAVDHLIVTPEYPAFNSKIELTNHIQAAGGEVATTMTGLERLGMKTCYVGRFGSDAEGEIGLAALQADGVDSSYCEKIPGARTQIAFIVIDERSGERTVIWQRDARLSYSAEESPIAAARAGKIFHFTPHDTAACLTMAKAAKEAGAIVSIDIDNVFTGIGELLPLVDVLIASQDFSEKLIGVSDAKTALAALQQLYGCAVVCVTQGESGALCLCGGEYFQGPGYAVPGGCKDTTGAGDSFRAGFLYGLLTGADVETTLKYANGVAALKCRALGARTSLPTIAELRDLIGT